MTGNTYKVSKYLDRQSAAKTAGKSAARVLNLSLRRQKYVNKFADLEESFILFIYLAYLLFIKQLCFSSDCRPIALNDRMIKNNETESIRNEGGAA
jgi:hypothetical protein